MILGLTYYREQNNILQNVAAKLRFKREVLRITQKHGVRGFTLLKALGAWDGKTEPSYQLLVENVPKRVVRALGEDFRDSFKQEAVMLKDSRGVEFI